MTLLLVAIGAAVGASLRFVVASRLDDDIPVGTLVVNIVGSFLLGLFSAWALDDHLVALLGAGFCGALTTYSSFAVQAHRLGTARGTAYAALTLVVALGACFGGFLLGG